MVLLFFYNPKLTEKCAPQVGLLSVLWYLLVTMCTVSSGTSLLCFTIWRKDINNPFAVKIHVQHLNMPPFLWMRFLSSVFEILMKYLKASHTRNG